MKLDRFLAWSLLALGCLQTASVLMLMFSVKLVSSPALSLLGSTTFYTPSGMVTGTPPLGVAWISSGAVLIFGAFLNLVRSYRPPDKLLSATSVLANLYLLSLTIFTGLVVLHHLKQSPQAVVLPVIAAGELIFSVKQWLL